MVELRTLAYFVTACRSGSFALAAADLDIAVSTLSTTLKALGEDLGLTLFRRINNSLYPTAAARGLMRAAEPLLTAELFARRLVRASPRARLRHLTVEIGLSFTIGGISRRLRRAIDMISAQSGRTSSSTWYGPTKRTFRISARWRRSLRGPSAAG